MDDTLQRPNGAPSSPAKKPAQAADPSETDESIPLSSSDFPDDAPEEDGDAQKKHRDIFRELAGKVKSPESADDDEPATSDAAGDDEQGTETATAATEKATATKPASEEAGDAALSTARDALVRDGWSSADLEKLPKERLLELGAKRSAAQKQQDGFGRAKSEEVATLKARLAELEGVSSVTTNQPPAGEQNAANAPAATPPHDPSADPAFAAIGKTLDALGDVASPEVQKIMKDSFAALHHAMDQRMRQQLSAITAATERQMLSASRTKLTESFPAMKDETKFTAVTKKMAALARTGDYGPGDMDALMTDAAKIVLPAPTIQDVQRKMLEESQKAQNGQMDAGQRSQAAGEKKSATDEDKNRSILRKMRKGMSPEQARRANMAT